MNMSRLTFASKYIVSTILIGLFFAAPLHTVFAQQQSGTASAFGSLNGGIRFGGTLANVLSCAGVSPGDIVDGVGDAIENFLGQGGDTEIIEGAPEGAGGALDFLNPLLDGDLEGAGQELVSSAPEIATQTAGAVAQPVQDIVTRQNTNQTKERAEEAAENTKWQVFKENCLDKIVRDMAVRTLNKITFSTVEWINSGFDGEAFFLKNPEQYFADIARDEFSIIFDEITIDEGLQPFGRTIVATITDTVRRRLEQNVTNSMWAVLDNATYQQWELDFSVGGWAAYTAFVEPNNNILGSYLTTTQALAQRTEGVYASRAISARAQLDQGLGFLAHTECVNTLAGNNLPHLSPEDPLYMPPGTPPIRTVQDIPPSQLDYIENELLEYFEEDQIAIAEQSRRQSICTQNRTLTPGSWIANSLNSATTDTNRDQLISADEWNENLGLIFDALLLQVFNTGIDRLYDASGNYSSDPNSPNYNPAWAGVNDPNFGNNFFQSGGNPSYYGPANISQIIQTQQAYQAQLALNANALALLIQRARELDYCIPGPYPNWSSALQSSVNSGLFVLSDAPAGASLSERQIYFANLFEDVTGVALDAETANIASSQELQSILIDVFNQYTNKLSEAYPQNTPPPQNRAVGATQYNLAENTYRPILLSLGTENGYVTNNISQLQTLQTQIANLGQGLTPEMSQMMQNQISNMPYLVTPEDVTSLQQSLSPIENLSSQIAFQRDACIQEVLSSDYEGLNYRTQYPVELSGAVANLPEHDSFLEDVQIGPGVDNIYPTFLPAGSIVSPAGLETFEEFLDPLF